MLCNWYEFTNDSSWLLSLIDFVTGDITNLRSDRLELRILYILYEPDVNSMNRPL